MDDIEHENCTRSTVIRRLAHFLDVLYPNGPHSILDLKSSVKSFLGEDSITHIKLKQLQTTGIARPV